MSFCINENYENDYYDTTLYCGSKLKKLEIPTSVKNIGAYAFYDSEITSVSIPNSVATVGSGAFKNCKNLTNITIGNGVTDIYEEAFNGCTSLKTVTTKAKTPPTLSSGVFEKNIATLYVPKGSLSAYQESDWATYFNTIVEAQNSKLSVEIEGNGWVYDSSNGNIISGTIFEGSDFEFFVFPEDGNVVSSITFEGQDITSSLVNHKLTISDFKGDGDGVLKIEFAPEADATLVVKGADTHAVRHTYKEGTSAVVELQPEDGWKIHSVTYNGEDVTDRLENNVFMTEPLHGENNLNMVLVSNSTVDIEAVSAAGSQVRISVNRNTVSIIGLDEDEPVSVYDVSGKTIYTGFDRSVTLKSGEAYILTTPSKTFKVAI